jgi:ZIP family zinc transporter
LRAGLFEFFGAVMTWLVFGDNLSSLFFGIVFSWIAGMVIFLALTHILPMGYAYDPYHGKFVGLFGFIGIFIMGIAMGISGES